MHKQPVYIFLPIDKTGDLVTSSSLSSVLNTDFPVNESVEALAIKDILLNLYTAQSPSVLVDYLAIRYASSETREFVGKLDVLHYSSHMGKGCIHENNPKYVGIYNGSLSMSGVTEAIESSDLCLSIGCLNADTNTAFFSRKISDGRHIIIMPDHVIVSSWVSFPTTGIILTLLLE